MVGVLLKAVDAYYSRAPDHTSVLGSTSARKIRLGAGDTSQGKNLDLNIIGICLPFFWTFLAY